LLELYHQGEMICKFQLYLFPLHECLPFSKFPEMVHSEDVLRLQELPVYKTLCLLQ
jgi:hypothetical protein